MGRIRVMQAANLEEFGDFMQAVEKAAPTGNLPVANPGNYPAAPAVNLQGKHYTDGYKTGFLMKIFLTDGAGVMVRRVLKLPVSKRHDVPALLCR